jgi:hypothetical protein
MTEQQRPKRQRQAKIWFDEKETYSQPPPTKKAKKKAVELLETRAVEDPPPQSVRTFLDMPMVEYNAPYRVLFTPIQQHWPESDPFTLFTRFLGQATVIAIVTATNDYAARDLASVGPRKRGVRLWHPLTYGEFLCWLGILLYMANNSKARRYEHWSTSDSFIASFMGRQRWEQIHRYLTFNTDQDAGTLSFFDKLEPIASMIRLSCEQAASPST